MAIENYKDELKAIYKSYVGGEIDSMEAFKQIINALPELTRIIFNVEGNFNLEAEINGVAERISLPYKANKRRERKKVVELISLLDAFTNRYLKQEGRSRNKINLGKSRSTKHKVRSLDDVLKFYSKPLFGGE